LGAGATPKSAAIMLLIVFGILFVFVLADMAV